MELRKGKIRGFKGSWMSGLGALVIEDSENGTVEDVHCDNGATVRALDACFGNVIGEGHTVNDKAWKGQEIYWSYDDMGLILGGFTPVEGASEELHDMYESHAV